MEERIKEATKNVQVLLKCRLQKAKVTSQECCCPLRAGQKRKQGPDLIAGELYFIPNV